MNGLNKWVPRLIALTALIHVAYGLVEPNTWGEIAREGFLGAVGDHTTASYEERGYDTWFLVAGTGFLVAMASLSQYSIRLHGRQSPLVGGYLLLFGVPLVVLHFPDPAPAVMIVLGILSLVAARTGQRTHIRSDQRQPQPLG